MIFGLKSSWWGPLSYPARKFILLQLRVKSVSSPPRRGVLPVYYYLIRDIYRFCLIRCKILGMFILGALLRSEQLSMKGMEYLFSRAFGQIGVAQSCLERIRAPKVNNPSYIIAWRSTETSLICSNLHRFANVKWTSKFCSSYYEIESQLQEPALFVHQINNVSKMELCKYFLNIHF